MSAFGGKADMTFAVHMSAFDPRRTFKRVVSRPLALVAMFSPSEMRYLYHLKLSLNGMHRVLCRAIANVRQTCAALACVSFLILATGAFSAEPRRVLIVHAFGHAYSPWSDEAGIFRAELVKQSKEPIDLYE